MRMKSTEPANDSNCDVTMSSMKKFRMFEADTVYEDDL